MSLAHSRAVPAHMWRVQYVAHPTRVVKSANASNLECTIVSSTQNVSMPHGSARHWQMSAQVTSAGLMWIGTPSFHGWWLRTPVLEF